VAGQFGVFVDIYLSEQYVRMFFRSRFEYWRKAAARPAPRSPEINENGVVIGEGALEIALSQRRRPAFGGIHGAGIYRCCGWLRHDIS
jgi:hypothetical protein